MRRSRLAALVAAALLPLQIHAVNEVMVNLGHPPCSGEFVVHFGTSTLRCILGHPPCSGPRPSPGEGRFKSQALLDEKALLAATAYVDLNPVRAGMAETPETSDYTSIQERPTTLPHEPVPENNASQPKGAADAPAHIEGETLHPQPKVASLPRAPLMPFDAAAQTPWAIPFAFDDYLELVDWTGRACVPGRRGQIPAGQPKILDRLGIDGERFIVYAERFLTAFGSAVGAPASLTDLCARQQTKYLRGMGAARKLFLARQAA